MMMKKYKTPVFLFGLIGLLAVASAWAGPVTPEKDNKVANERYYPAAETEGFIGVFKEKPLDSPADNVFTVNLDALPTADEQVWLTYDLYGISDHTGISRSVNSQLAVGGYFVTLHKGWQSQKERLKASWLQSGANKIRFTLPENVSYNYRIKNLGIRIVKEGSNKRAIVINQPLTRSYANDLGYLKGFVQGKDSKKAAVFVDNIEMHTLSSEFEALIPKKTANTTWTSLIKVVFPDGETISKKITFQKQLQPHFQNKIKARSAHYNIAHYTPEKDFTLTLESASINLVAQALEDSKPLSITALRSIDIPALDGTMVNVTKNHSGYRFLPQGTSFKKEGRMSLGYEPDKIPEGYTAADIKTYYFDENTKHWVALKKAKDDQKTGEISSVLQDFNNTDYINGIIKVPESPETSGFTPTSIKDIKAANPGAAVNLLDPPSANNRGSANMGYPIVLPGGRQGMQPQLGIQYNSTGGNDWLGMGWNLSIPSISIDTRWGVPRYNSGMETETYTMDGSQLAPVAHRGELVARSAEKQFHPRVEGSFNKIIRHGDNPKNYWWEVTDKSGTTYSYGGSANLGVVENSVLKDANGNIAHWALVETRDLNQNFVRYHCTRVDDTGLSGGTVPGRNIYIDRITYTGHGSSEGKYAVQFTRDRELGESKRPDVTINGRYGFKQVTADLLRKIEVKFNGQAVRSYELTYQEGAFYKTLLKEIIEYDAIGTEFTRHNFDYYDDVKAAEGYKPLGSEEQWTPQSDTVHGDFINPFEDFNDDASAISGTKSANFGFGFALTVGVADGNNTCKSLTVGADIGFGWANNQGILALIDINGDGLSDKVFINEDSFYYRPNESGPEGTPTFGEKIPLSDSGIELFYKDRSSNSGFGIQGNGGCNGVSAFVGLRKNKSKNTTTIYFSDVNGDQLIDVAISGRVFFNHINEDNIPVFTTDSNDTPSPVNQNGSVDPAVVTLDPAELEEAIDTNPLHDTVRMWEAPYDGTVSISGDISLLLLPEPADNTDGVSAAIQLEDTELWKTSILANDFTSHTPTGVSGLGVSKGDRIYFRLQSVFNGADDRVSWNPVVTYDTHSPDEIDANNKPLYEFTASDGFKLSGEYSVSMAIDGTISLEGPFIKPPTSDNITARVTNETTGAIVWQGNYSAADDISENLAISLDVLEGETLSFKVLADTNVDWSAIEWAPHIYYTASANPAIPDDNLIDARGDPTIAYFPVVFYSMYNDLRYKTAVYQAGANGTLTVDPRPNFNASANGALYFTVKKLNELVSKQALSVAAGAVSGTSAVSIPLLQDEKVFLEYHITDPLLADAFNAPDVDVTFGGATSNLRAGLFTTEQELIFGPLYRRWGQFAYNGNRNRADMPINQSELALDPALLAAGTIDLSGATTPEEMEAAYLAQGGFVPADSKFIMMIPDASEAAWVGYDNLSWVKAASMSSSRLGEDDLTLLNPIPDPGDGTGARSINKVSKSSSLSFSAGGGGGGANLSFSTTDGDTEVISDFMDMNGDRYTDIVTSSHIQYTKANGGLENAGKTHGQGVNNLSSNTSSGGTLGGTYATTNSQGTIYNIKNRQLVEGQGAGGGINGNYGEGENEVNFSWKDINGDGLPDRVYEGGDVALNLGYSFTATEPWGYTPIQEGQSTTKGLGLGINWGNNSLAAGISLSRSDAESEKMLMDVNGDGLTDELILKNPIEVRINTGNGFAAPINWTGAYSISENASTSESANAAFTVCVQIFAVKICFNPSINIGQGAGRELLQFQDINGDGFPDFLTSTKDDNLTVKRSTIGRTNLLKSVQRPMGASFALDYKRVGNTYEQPQDVWTLQTVAMFDGFTGDGADTMLSSFEYENGFYDRHERDFYGFKTVKSHQHDTQSGNSIYRSVVQEFINDNYYEKGMLVREILQDGAQNLYTESINTYQLKNVFTGADLPDTFRQNAAGTAFVAITETLKNFYEGQATAGKSTRMTFNYDILGNVIGYTDFGDEGSADDYSSSISYHNITSNYIVGTPSEITVTANGQTQRRRQTDIDSNTGNLTQIRKYLQSGGAARFDMAYDAFGNLTKITRPENASGERMFYEYQYDAQVNTYTTQITDVYGYTSASEYDFRFGQMLLNTDLNGHQMRYEIDNLGRITTITGPFELEKGLPYTLAFDYHPLAQVPWARTRHYDPAHPDNDLETVTFADGLKRGLQVKKDAAIYAAPQTPDEEKMIVSGRVLFDAFGRATTSYYPVTEAKGGESSFNAIFDEVQPTVTAYDVLDRALTVTLPDNAVTRTQYAFGSDREGKTQFSTKVTDANGIWKESFTNVRGLTKAVTEQYSQGSNIWTSYNYNAINELITVKDDQDNLINSSYDWFGRRTEVVHPDAGTTTFAYDLASNLTQKVTANLAAAGTGITYAYDHERLTNINYPENPQNNVTYTYGDAGAASNRAGRIALQEDATGAQEFFYNQLGAVIKNIRTIVIPNAETLTYTTEWEYDTWNRVTGMVYPDSETLTYNYNLGGLLHSFSGKKDGTDYEYVKQLGYDKFEQRLYLGYGNGTETFYSYEPERRRLKTMVAETADDRKMMDNVYTYDKVNNILRLQNNAEIPASNLMGGQTDYNYTYDDLYRLTHATGSHLGSNHENRYSLAMQYNSIHSIVKKDQLHQFKSLNSDNWSPRNKTTYTYDYEYGENQPHAPVHIGEKTYTYDANGNQTGWDSDVSGQRRDILWDEENRIKAIADNGAVFSYVYDAGGERVLKSKGGGQSVRVNGANAGGNGGIGNYTIYVNPYVVVSNRQTSKHFFIENQRVVTKLAESSDGLLQLTAGSGMGSNINYGNKKQKLKAGLAKAYSDLGLEVTAVDTSPGQGAGGEAGNSGQTPPNGNANGQQGNGNNGNDGDNGNAQGNGNGNGNGNGGGNNGGGNGNGNGGGNNGGGNGNGNGGGNGNNIEAFVYYYHPDHLGSSSYITDANGEVTQHIEYFAFGETFLEEHSNTDRTPYLFNGKELDEETGLYYYGARYYDPVTSVWQSVDPLAEKYPNISPFAFTANNPLNVFDPDGKDIFYINRDGSIEKVEQQGAHQFLMQTVGTSTDYHNNYQLIANLTENTSGLVQFPASGNNFSRYGTNDAGGTDSVINETVGQGDHYVTPETAAALYGVIEVSGVSDISIGDMSSSNGSDPWQASWVTPSNQNTSRGHHAGHGHNGNYSGQELDFRYLDTNNESFQSPNAFNSSNYSASNNQTLYDTAEDFGFDRRFQGNSGNLNGATNINGHNNHGHFGRSDNNNNISTLRTPKPNAPFAPGLRGTINTLDF